MDPLTVVGLLVAVGAIVIGQQLEGGTVASLINGPALLIVGGGTLGAAMVQSPLAVFARSMRMLVWVLRPPVPPKEKTLEDIIEWGHIARKDGLLGLENVVEQAHDLFARKGLQLLVDGNEPATIRDTLELDVGAREHSELQAAKVLEGMGGYAPTIGILGAVMGLIQVLGNLSDPAQLGSGIAVAFVATIYGVGLANLVLIPAGNKLKTLVLERSHYQEMIIEGIVAIAQGENPRIIETRLQGLVR
ncbi:MAG: flagellar motor protein [Gammaproteobacteria bacterium]|nr:flagellar motor protein [Gammaproteobacteria bacterium]